MNLAAGTLAGAVQGGLAFALLGMGQIALGVTALVAFLLFVIWYLTAS